MLEKLAIHGLRGSVPVLVGIKRRLQLALGVISGGVLLVGLLCQQMKEHVVIHVVQRVHVDTQRVGNAAHVQSERFQKLDEIHFFTYRKTVELNDKPSNRQSTTDKQIVVVLFTSKRIVQFGTDAIALRPRTPIH